MPSKPSRSSSSKRSSTPHLNAPWLPPLCSARLTIFCSTTAVCSGEAAFASTSVSWSRWTSGHLRREVILTVRGRMLVWVFCGRGGLGGGGGGGGWRLFSRRRAGGGG